MRRGPSALRLSMVSRKRRDFTTLTLKRVAGQAQRITFKEADTDDTDDGERGASARYEAEACDSLANSAHRCACAARLTTSTTNDADDDLTNLCQLEVRRWVKGSDPADATVDLLSLDANDVAVVLEETDATFIEVRLVDATGNKQPIEDLRVSLAMKIYPQNGEDDVDGQLNVARTVELRLENELGAAAREPPRGLWRLPRHRCRPERRSPPAPAPVPRRKAKTGASGEARSARARLRRTARLATVPAGTCPISKPRGAASHRRGWQDPRAGTSSGGCARKSRRSRINGWALSERAPLRPEHSQGPRENGLVDAPTQPPPGTRFRRPRS